MLEHACGDDVITASHDDEDPKEIERIHECGVDYHPPSLLAAPFVDTGELLPEQVVRVTKNPADAVGLTDRGRIEAGARADLILVDTVDTPTISRAFVVGRQVYLTEGRQ